MGSFFISLKIDYGADTVMFALSIVLLALPVAALIVASLLDGPMRQRASRGRPAPVPTRRSEIRYARACREGRSWALRPKG
jgi:hypothetical protein